MSATQQAIRDEERAMRITCGQVAIVWCSTKQAWVLPGGGTTTNRGHAHRRAAELDRMIK